jgi:hypothetical protein
MRNSIVSSMIRRFELVALSLIVLVAFTGCAKYSARGSLDRGQIDLAKQYLAEYPVDEQNEILTQWCGEAGRKKSVQGLKNLSTCHRYGFGGFSVDTNYANQLSALATSQELEIEKEKAVRRAQDNKEAGKMLLTGMASYLAGGGFNPSAQPTNETSTYTAPSLATGPGKTCSYKTDCDINQICLKPEFGSNGFCVKPVDSDGLPVPGLIDSDNALKCITMVDCPIGFECNKSLGGFEGFCLKR